MSRPRTKSNVQATRRRAAAAGRATDRFVAFALERLEDLSLWALEQAAEGRPGDERLRRAEERLGQLRSLAAPLPRVTGRLVAGSSYFGMRWLPEVVGAAKKIRRETSAFLKSEPEAQED
jgi:hypothetical protein